jgi:ribonuclease HI
LSELQPDTLRGGVGTETGLIIYIDGASRGNPGPAAIGMIFLSPDGNKLGEESAFIGKATNNVAEYTALVEALRKAREMGVREVVVKTDSELLFRQIRGTYRVKNSKLIPLFREAMALSQGFFRFQIQHIPRDENWRADQLANLALDTLSNDPNEAVAPRARVGS